MRIVLDTNVLIAAFIARGAGHELLEHCILHHSLAPSEFTLAEVTEKLIEKFQFTAERAGEMDVLLRSRMELVVPNTLGSPVCRDPDDDNILAQQRAIASASLQVTKICSSSSSSAALSSSALPRFQTTKEQSDFSHASVPSPDRCARRVLPGRVRRELKRLAQTGWRRQSATEAVRRSLRKMRPAASG